MHIQKRDEADAIKDETTTISSSCCILKFCYLYILHFYKIHQWIQVKALPVPPFISLLFDWIKMTDKLFHVIFKSINLLKVTMELVVILLIPFIAVHPPIWLYNLLILCNIRLGKCIISWRKNFFNFTLYGNIEIFL